MAIDEKNLDQQYKDYLKKIELGEDEEEIELVDPEEYDDLGGIKSLDKAPSIKMASAPKENSLNKIFKLYKEMKEKGDIPENMTLKDFVELITNNAAVKNNEEDMAEDMAEDKTMMADGGKIDSKGIAGIKKLLKQKLG